MLRKDTFTPTGDVVLVRKGHYTAAKVLWVEGPLLGLQFYRAVNNPALSMQFARKQWRSRVVSLSGLLRLSSLVVLSATPQTLPALLKNEVRSIIAGFNP